MPTTTRSGWSNVATLSASRPERVSATTSMPARAEDRADPGPHERELVGDERALLYGFVVVTGAVAHGFVRLHRVPPEPA